MPRAGLDTACRLRGCGRERRLATRGDAAGMAARGVDALGNIPASANSSMPWKAYSISTGDVASLCAEEAAPLLGN